MPEGTSVSWSQITSFRAEAFERFGSILDMPFVDISAELDRLVKAAGDILDFGAGVEQPLRTRVKEGSRYWSLDADPLGSFDFADLSEIPEAVRFDLAIANQVLEHIPLDAAVETVHGLAGVLRPGGALAATVPNPSHPVRHWADATHVTQWPVFDLYSVFRVAGLEVDLLARYGKRRLPRRPLRRLIVRAVAVEFRIDWADSLLIVGRKPA
jgi:SAM-dependent methyltransferase